MPHHQGQCHCGNIRYIFESRFKIDELALRQCDCSYCQRQGARYVSDPDGALHITLSHKDAVTRYRFGHKTADFIFCTTCGVMPFVTCAVAGKTLAVVNVNSLDEALQLRGDLATSHLGDEETDERLTRRQKNWIGKVSFT